MLWNLESPRKVNNMNNGITLRDKYVNLGGTKRNYNAILKTDESVQDINEIVI